MSEHLSATASILRGAVDMHVHAGPDAQVPRRLDALRLAKLAKDYELKAVVIKNKTTGTGALAKLVTELVPEVATIGSVTLDTCNGGLNAERVEFEARLGSRVVWMPTYSAKNDRESHGLTGGISILETDGTLRPEVREVFDIIREYSLVLCTGHLSREEVMVLTREAIAAKVERVVVSHPLTRVAARLSIEDQKSLVNEGAFMEHCLAAAMLGHAEVPIERFVEAIRAVSARHCVVSSDFGQWQDPPAPEGLRMGIAWFLRHGLKEDELETMVKSNPIQLLAL